MDSATSRKTPEEELAPEERALISLHGVEGYILAESERTPKVSLGTLKWRLHRTRRKVREALKREPFAADLRVKG